MYSQEFKAGLLMPDKGFKECCFYIPNSGLITYDQPNGKSLGKISLGTPDQHNEVYTAFIEENGVQKILDTSLTMVGYEIMALVYTDSKPGFLQLENGNWINSEEVISKHLKLTSWKEYAIEKDSEWYANPPGLNLREGPSTDFNKIVTLKGDLFGITLTSESKGKWSKVTVKQYRHHPCSGEDDILIKTYSGWIKLISKEETLNVWNYAKGC